MSPACASPATEPREYFHRIGYGAGATGERARSPATVVRRGVMLAVALLHSVRSSSAVTWRSGSGTRLEFDSSTNYLTLSCEESGSYSCGELAGAGVALAAGAGRVVAAARLHVRDCELRAPLACVPGAPAATELMLENTWGPIALGLSGLPAVQSIEIEADDNNITMTSMPYATLSGLADLTELRVRGGVSSLAPGAGGAELARLRDLEVAECEELRELPAAALRPLPALAVLSLWGNSIRLVHKDALFCQGPTELKLLNLNDNELSSLPAGVFIGCAALTDLHLNHNRLRTLFDSAVAGATWLERVDLSYNELEVLPLNELGGLWGLVHLDVSNNRLRAVRGAYRDGRTQPLPLLTLNLSGNNLTTLDRSSLEGLLALQELDLSENYLMRLNPDTFFAVRMHLTNLSVSGNGLLAECGEEPSPLRELMALRHLELGRNNLTAVCGDWRALPHLHRIDLSHNTIRRLDARDLTWASPAIVDLNSNCITATALGEEERRPAPGVTLPEVNLRHNLLTEVPRGLTARVRALRLAGNPLRCECDAALPAGLRSHERLVLDLDEVTCAADDGGRCGAGGPLIAGAALAAGVVVVGGVALAWYGRRGRGRRRELCYDVFLSVAEEDAAWAWAAAVPALERGGRRVCVPERDWRPGAQIAAQGAQSVRAARRTVAVLSGAAARCGWRRRELAAAVRLRRAVVLLRDDAGPPPALPSGVRAVVRASDPRVWDKLRKAVR